MTQSRPLGAEDFLAACATHPVPMALLTGPDLLLGYNEACAALLGDRHRNARDRPCREAWPALHRALAGDDAEGRVEPDAEGDGRQVLTGPVRGRLSVLGVDDVVTSYRFVGGPLGPAGQTHDAVLLVFQPEAASGPTVTGQTSVTGPSDTDQPVTNQQATSRSETDRAATATRGRSAESMTGVTEDLADLASLDLGTICAALGRLTVPSQARWAIVWTLGADRTGRVRLERRDVPVQGRRRVGSWALANRLGVGRVISTGAPVTARTPPGAGLPGGPVLSVPLRDKRRVVGALTLGDPVDRLDRGRLQDLADRAGLAVANASRFRVERSISRDLQRMLAPRPLPSVRGVELAARLIAGSPGVTIGGDWYDAGLLPDGRLALTIGDVVGHGLRSAVEMAQLRTGLRNLALEGLEPAEVLAGADEFLQRTGEARFVTCIHAVYRPDTGQLDLANAGHPRPVHLPADGRPRMVSLGTGLPLGGAADLARSADRVPIATCRIMLRPGESVLLFTDGLVEDRSHSTDQGITRLMETLARAAGVPAGLSGGRLRRRRGASRPWPGARELCSLALSARSATARDDRDDAGGTRSRGEDGERDDVAVLVLRRRQRR